jgi:hypothetical protein
MCDCERPTGHWTPAWCNEHGFTVVPVDWDFLAGQWTCWRCELESVERVVALAHREEDAP